MSRKNLINTNS